MNQAITGHADVNTAVQTLKAGAPDFLQKPVDAEKLEASIENASHIGLARSLGRLSSAQVTEVFIEMSSREKRSRNC